MYVIKITYICIMFKKNLTIIYILIVNNYNYESKINLSKIKNLV